MPSWKFTFRWVNDNCTLIRVLKKTRARFTSKIIYNSLCSPLPDVRTKLNSHTLCNWHGRIREISHPSLFFPYVWVFLLRIRPKTFQTSTNEIKIYLIIFTLHWTSIFLTIKILVKAQQFWILLHHTVVQFISWMNEWWYFKANCTLTVLKLVSLLNYISSISISNSTARLFQFPIVPFRENAQQRGLEGDFDPPPRGIFV